jgi:hypothetical protein
MSKDIFPCLKHQEVKIYLHFFKSLQNKQQEKSDCLFLKIVFSLTYPNFSTTLTSLVNKPIDHATQVTLFTAPKKS